jgi:hypothetical protein
VFTKAFGNRQSRTPLFCGHSKFNGFEAQRRREIEAHARHIGAAETEDFSRWLTAWVWHNSNAKDQVWSLLEAAKRMGGEISEPEAAAIIDEAVNTHRPPLLADDLGRFLGLGYDLRRALGIRTIGSIDVDKEGRKEIRKLQDRKRKERKRRRLGMRLHSESISQTQPWNALGVSRRTWYRRQQDDGARVTRPLAKRAAASIVVGTTLSAAIKKEDCGQNRANDCGQICATSADTPISRVQRPQWQVYSHAVPLTKAVRAMKDRLEAARNGEWRR